MNSGRISFQVPCERISKSSLATSESEVVSIKLDLHRVQPCPPDK